MADNDIENVRPRNIFTTINFWKPYLSKTESRIAQYFYDHPHEASSLSMVRVAEKCNCGEGSIDRFCKKLGYSGFAQIKEMLATQPIPSGGMKNQVEIDQKKSVEALAYNICDLYTETMHRTMELNPPANFQIATQKIAYAKRIFMFGIGDALIPCLCANYRFRRIGFNCIFDFDSDMQLINSSNVQPGDVAIAISHSGMTHTVNEAMKTAHESGAFTIGITQSVKSHMTQYCDLLFFNATSDITVGKTIVAHRFAENTIIEILYAGVVSLIPTQASEQLKKSSEILAANKDSNI